MVEQRINRLDVTTVTALPMFAFAAIAQRYDELHHHHRVFINGYSCISPTSRRSRRGRSSRSPRGHGRYGSGHTTAVITVTNLRFGRIGASGGNDQSTSATLCHFLAVCHSQSSSRSSSSPSAMADLCSAVRGIDPDCCFPAAVLLAANFSRRRFVSSSAFGSSTSGIAGLHSTFNVGAADDARGSQRTRARGQHDLGTTGTTDTVNVRLRIHRDIVVNYRADTLNVQPRAATSVAISQDVQTIIFRRSKVSGSRSARFMSLFSAALL